MSRAPLVLAALCIVAACDGPGDGAHDSGADANVDADALACEPSSICLGGELDTTYVSFRAGWWSPWREGTRTGITGGFTSADIDACGYVLRGERLPFDAWSFGFFLFSNEEDSNADGLPDLGDYPVIPGWGGTHSEPRGVEVGVDRNPPDWRQFASAGRILIQDIHEATLSVDVDVELDNDGGRVTGSVTDLARCDPF